MAAKPNGRGKKKEEELTLNEVFKSATKYKEQLRQIFEKQEESLRQILQKQDEEMRQSLGPQLQEIQDKPK